MFRFQSLERLAANLAISHTGSWAVKYGIVLPCLDEHLAGFGSYVKLVSHVRAMP